MRPTVVAARTTCPIAATASAAAVTAAAVNASLWAVSVQTIRTAANAGLSVTLRPVGVVNLGAAGATLQRGWKIAGPGPAAQRGHAAADGTAAGLTKLACQAGSAAPVPVFAKKQTARRCVVGTRTRAARRVAMISMRLMQEIAALAVEVAW